LSVKNSKRNTWNAKGNYNGEKVRITVKLAERMSTVKPSPTLAVTAKAKAMKAQGIDVVGFGAGEPDFDTPKNIKEAAIKAIEEGFTKYTPSGGIEELKDAIIDKFKNENGLSYDRSQIVVTCGAKHAIYALAQAILNEGDEVIIPSPYWVSYPDIVSLMGGKPVIVEAKEKDGFKIDPARLKKAITPKTKAMVINSPSNPTGAAYEPSELLKIAEIAVEKGILVISDEIYERFVYDGFKFSSIASLGKEIKDQTIVINGVSKTYSMTGWRIGYAAGPKEIINAITDLQSQSTSNPTSIAQKASVEALRGSQDSVAVMVEEFDRRRRAMVDKLNSLPGVSCFNPQGAFYCFPNLSSYYGKSLKDKKIKGSADMSTYLLEEAKVAVVSGDAFGADEHIRLSYAISSESIRKGLERIEDALKKLS
jgi:aspartate aminotransferase